MADAAHSACKTRRRWFRITPDRVVLGLLALEVLLLLSERFGWFSLDQHKGWAVLIAAASVGATFLLAFLWFLVALLFRWRFQFSVRSLLLLAVIVAILFGWLVPERERARKQREAVAAIRALGGCVGYDYEMDRMRQRLAFQAGKGPPEPPGPPLPLGPAWRHRLLGDDFFADVITVDHPRPLFHSNRSGSNPITDAWLEHIGKLPRLEELDLRYSKVSDVGLGSLVGLMVPPEVGPRRYENYERRLGAG